MERVKVSSIKNDDNVLEVGMHYPQASVFMGSELLSFSSQQLRSLWHWNNKSCLNASFSFSTDNCKYLLQMGTINSYSSDNVVVIIEGASNKVFEFASFNHGNDVLEIENVGISLLNNTISKDLEFVYQLRQEETNNELKAIDFLYKYIDSLVEKNAFFRIDSIMSLIIQKGFKLRLVVALLTITHGIKEAVVNREKVLTYAKVQGSKENLSSKQISSILKGF